jgi:hypothetical protein
MQVRGILAHDRVVTGLLPVAVGDEAILRRRLGPDAR